MIKQEHAIVLKMRAYKESDGLATLLLEKGGLRNFLYRGYFKPKSKVLATGIPLTLIQFDYVDKPDGLLQTRQATVINNYNALKNDIIAVQVANVYVEITSAIAHHDYDSEFFFQLGTTLFQALESGFNTDVCLACLIAMVCKQHGISPEVDGDVYHKGTKVNGFSIKEGGFVLQSHSTYNQNQLKQLRLLFKIDFTLLEHVVDLQVDQNVLSTMIEYFIFHTGIKLNSYTIYKELK